MHTVKFVVASMFILVSAATVLAQEPINALVEDISINSVHEAVEEAIPEIMGANNLENMEDIENMEDLENQEIVNDEGYGAEDVEYYGSEEEMNVQENAEEEEADVPVNGEAR